MDLFVFRSYGDLIILLNVLQQGDPKESLNLNVSKHLKPLIEELPQLNLSDNIVINYFDIGINKGILRLFTNKDLVSLSTILELFRFKKVAHSYSTIYLEQTARSWLLQLLFPSKHFIPIFTTGNIYESYAVYFLKNTASSNFTNIPNLKLYQKPTDNSTKRILLFPSSRKATKQLPNKLIKKVLSANKQIIEACFGAGVDNYNKVYYSSFGKLIELIKASDYVISSDSLPVHLAFYLGVPHYILYPKKVNNNWLTPYAKVNKTYGIFEAHENLYPIINNIIG